MRLSKCAVLFTAICILAAVLQSRGDAQSSFKERKDFSIGQPRVWGYQRVYPFLDGIFQDVASTQLSPLVLNPNSANASSLNATSFGVQGGASFSPVTAAQNQLFQQQNAAAAANATIQTQLLNQLIAQQTTLAQQLTAANQQAAQDNATFQQYVQSGNASSAQLTAAQAVVTNDNAVVTNLNNQMANLKAQIATPTAATTPTFASPSAPPGSGASSLPSSFSAPPGASAPNFPASKAMDNQVNLLWERLSRLVATLSESDNLNGYQFLLASFNVDLMPVKRKKQIFALRYCFQAAEADRCYASGNGPRIVDLYPSASAVNIVNNKYVDKRFGVGMIAALFSTNLNAQLNYEHLQMTQSLGQSAYITGYGIGTGEFGWAFGRNLGDDSISPGSRTVFAIIAVPPGVGNFEIRAESAGWLDENSRLGVWGAQQSKNLPAKALVTVIPQIRTPSIEQVDYTPIEFDPLSATNSPSAIQLTVDRPIDPQMTLSVDGRVINRARDTFGRAISGGGSGGLLESTSFGQDTWIPLASDKISLLLNPVRTERRFPSIVIQGPYGGSTLGSINGTDVKVSGNAVRCASTACDLSELLPLSYRKATDKSAVVYHWDQDIPKNLPAQIFVSIPSDVTPAQKAAAGNNAPTLQIITDQGSSPWGSNTTVSLTIGGVVHKLNCQPLDFRLRCAYPGDLDSDSWTLQVRDPDHVGGPVSTSRTFDSTTDPKFILWSFTPPHWYSSVAGGNPDTLVFCAATIGDPSPIVYLGSSSGTILSNLRFQALTGSQPKYSGGKPSFCPPYSGRQPNWKGELQIDIAQLSQITDQMTLIDQNDSTHPVVLLNLHAVASPLLSDITSDDLNFVGQNLVFSKLRVGTDPKTYDLDCIGGTACSVKFATADDPDCAKAESSTCTHNLGTKAGYISFVDDKGFAIVMQKFDGTTMTKIQYTPVAKNSGAQGDGSGGGGNQFSMSLSVSGSGGGSAAAPPGGTTSNVAPLTTPGNANSTAPPTPPPSTLVPATAAVAKPQVIAIQ